MDGGGAAWCGVDVKLAAHHFDAFLHAEESEARRFLRAGEAADGEAGAVVLDFHVNL